jgi:hypothetical protein
MTQLPNSVIYLPPGVVPAAPPVPLHTGIPFDRQFFEAVLPRAVDAFCKQVTCDTPRVELYTLDGSTHFVNGVSGVTDSWVALQTSREDHDHTSQVFVPYQTIFRVEIHPESDGARRKLGFILEGSLKTPPAVQPAQIAAPAPVAEAKATRKPRTRAKATK